MGFIRQKKKEGIKSYPHRIDFFSSPSGEGANEAVY